MVDSKLVMNNLPFLGRFSILSLLFLYDSNPLWGNTFVPVE